jgi:hypothetical protein
MRYLIIRACKRDEAIADRCVKSSSVINPDKIIYFAEKGEYSFDGEIIYRSFADNFLGESNVIQLFKDMKQLPTVNDDDQVVFSDSDIIFGNYFGFDFDWGGVCDEGVIPYKDEMLRHTSGQCQVIKGSLWNKIINISDEDLHEVIMASYKYEICDDIIISIILHRENPIFKNLSEYWEHVK